MLYEEGGALLSMIGFVEELEPAVFAAIEILIFFLHMQVDIK